MGQTLGRYKLLERVGEGGCGVVYGADRTEPVRRRVALKAINPGMDTQQVVARFEAERQALAMMDHPNIATMLGGGRSRQSSANQFQRLPFGRLGFREGRDALVQRGQHATPSDREAQQVGIRDLLMAHQPDAGKGDRFGDRKFIRPEGVVLGSRVGGENLNGFARLDGIAGKSGVRHDSNEAGLRDGARRPAPRAMTGEPLQRQIMPLMPVRLLRFLGR